MRDYEALVICDPKLEEGDIQKAIDRFSAAITDRDGKVAKIDRWGIRRFAYEINHQNEGYYFAVSFSAAEESVGEIERVVNIADEFIRGKITRANPAGDVPKKAPVAAPAAATPAPTAAPAATEESAASEEPAAAEAQESSN